MRLTWLAIGTVGTSLFLTPGPLPPARPLSQQPEGAQQQGQDTEVLSVLKLRHVEVSRVAEDIKVLLPVEAKIVADERTNALIIRATPEAAKKIMELMSKLDVPTEENENIVRRPRRDFSESSGVLEVKYEELEREIRFLADRLKALEPNFGSDKYEPQTEKATEIADRLRHMVSQAFDTRHRLQQVEMQQIRNRLGKLEDAMAQRLDERDQIIQDRIVSLGRHPEPPQNQPKQRSPYARTNPLIQTNSNPPQAPNQISVIEHIRQLETAQSDYESSIDELALIEAEYSSRKEALEHASTLLKKGFKADVKKEAADVRVSEIQLQNAQSRIERLKKMLDITARSAKASKALLELDLRAARQQLEHTQKELERAQMLADRKAITSSVLDEIRSNQFQVESELQKREIILELYNESLEAVLPKSEKRQ